MSKRQDKITIFGPKADGTYFVKFRTAAGESLAISVPTGEAAVLKYFQARMPLWTGRAGRGCGPRVKVARSPE